MEMAKRKERDEDKNEAGSDKGSSWSRNLVNTTVDAPRASRAAATESIKSRGKILTSVLQYPTTKYQKTSSCDQIQEPRGANRDKSAAPRGAAIVEPGHSEMKRIPREARDNESEGKWGRQEALNG